MERVVVTGIGIVSAIGMGKEEFWNNAINGKNGIGRVEKFDTSNYKTDIGGEIKNFTPYINNIDTQSIGLAAKYAVSAARLAFDDANADEIEDISGNAAVFMGTTMGEGDEMRRAIENGGNVLPCAAHNIPSAVAKEFNITGDAMLIPNACTAGNFAIIGAYERIRKENIRYAFAGGADILSETAYLGFSKLRSLAVNQARPFDKNREGMVIGEGAGVLFLESYSSAIKRGANIYAEIVGWGASCDAHHMAMPREDAKGIKKAMRMALDTSGIKTDEIDYVCAHGTGTYTNDKAEARAINELFDRRVCVSSVKSMIGHAMGAASAIEAGVCCMAVKYGIIPPTINHIEDDEECDIDCVPNEARYMRVKVAANNAYAFGGNNTCILFKECI